MTYLRAWLGAAIALATCVVLLNLTEHPTLLASLGGSCVIVFGMRESDMAQPRSLFGGHIIATLTGLVCLHLWRTVGGGSEIWMVIAVATALALMMATRTIHSPAGANPIVIFLEGASWGFIVAPVLVGLVIVFATGLVVHNLDRSGRRYPARWR